MNKDLLTTTELTYMEIRVLRMMRGEAEGAWGAAVSVAIESLAGKGLIFEHGGVYNLTSEGHMFCARALGTRAFRE